MYTPAEPPSPFTPAGRVRNRAWQIPMEQAVAAAEAAGFHVTTRSGPSRVYVQRGLWMAASITPTPAGVLVKRSWTLAQTAVLGVVLVLIMLCLGGPGMSYPVVE